MPEKGTLCKAATRLETCEGLGGRLHGLLWGMGGLEGREKASGMLLSGNIVLPCVNGIYVSLC